MLLLFFMPPPFSSYGHFLKCEPYEFSKPPVLLEEKATRKCSDTVSILAIVTGGLRAQVEKYCLSPFALTHWVSLPESCSVPVNNGIQFSAPHSTRDLRQTLTSGTSWHPGPAFSRGQSVHFHVEAEIQSSPSTLQKMKQAEYHPTDHQDMYV